jgi:hypothetical protein
MLGADAPRRPSGRHFRDAAHPLVSLRSPLPLIVAGIGVTLLVIAAVTLPPRPTVETQTHNLSQQEALSIVAHEMRSGAAAQRVMNEGVTRFDDGSWYVSVDSAHFHFTQRNHIVVAEDAPAVQLQYASGP